MRTRSNMIKVMLNDKELEHLEKQLEISGLNKSVLIRKLIMKLQVTPAPVDEYRKIYALLSNVTNNLNQMKRYTNATNPLDEEKLDAAIVLIRKCFQRLQELR